MEYSTYKIVRGIYQGTETELITIPSDVVLLTGGSHDIGRSLHNGHLHYIGYVKAPYEEVAEKCNGLSVTVQKFREDDCFITIHDIKFLEESPKKIINPDVMSPNQYANSLAKWNKTVGVGRYGDEYEFIAYWENNGKLVNMSKIVNIKSEYNIQLNTVWNSSCLKDIRIVEQTTINLAVLCLSCNFTKAKSVIVNGHIANAYWIKLLKNVLSPFGIITGRDEEVNFNDIDIDKLYNMFQEFNKTNKLDYKKADAIMHMKEI